ncbi:hypothetical protein TMEC54S_00233 [Thauera mechernichensis]
MIQKEKNPRMPTLRITNGAEALALRKKLRLNQTVFWLKVGVMQSTGCRYEKRERDIPLPVQFLLQLTYGTEKQSSSLLKYLRTVE